MIREFDTTFKKKKFVNDLSTIKYCHSVSIESLYSTFDILRSQWSPYKFRLTSPDVTQQKQAVCLPTSKNMPADCH
jgi:hypothetical protein